MPDLVSTGFFGGNQPAWHGKGIVIPENVITSAQALQVSGLDFTVGMGKVQVEYNGNVTVDTEHHAIVREDTGAVLGIVGSVYRPKQNVECFAFMDELLDGPEASADMPLPKWHTAGSLEGGKRIWLLAEIPGTVKVGGLMGEELRKYMFFTTSHDGSTPITVAPTPVRIVCNNTLQMAIDGADRKYVVRHTEGADTKLSEARRILQLTYTYYDRLEVVSTAMVNQRFTPRMFDTLVDELIPLPAREKSPRAHTNATQERYNLVKVYNDAPNLQNVKGTAWGAFNAVAEFTDHHMKGRGTKVSDAAENRMKRILSDTSLKDKAQKVIRELVTVG